MKDKEVTTEKAQKEACTLLKKGHAAVRMIEGGTTLVSVFDSEGEKVATFDLRDCYRLRKPLKGVTKKLRKAIR